MDTDADTCLAKAKLSVGVPINEMIELSNKI